MNYDGIKIGDIFSENYFNANLVGSKAWNVLYQAKYRNDLTAQSIGVKNTGTTDNSNVYEVVEVNLEGGGGTGAVSSVNGLTGVVTLYADNMKINNTNNDSVETELERLNVTKLAATEHKVSKALDVEPPTEDTLGLLFYGGNNQYVHGGVVQEAIPIFSNMRLGLNESIGYTNSTITNNIIPFQLLSATGTDFAYQNNGVIFNTVPSDFSGWARFSLATTCRKQIYPLLVTVGTLVNGLPGSYDIYLFNNDTTQGFQLNAKNDAPINVGDVVQFYITVDKPLSINDTVTIMNESYAFVEDRGNQFSFFKLKRDFLQSSNISLKNTAPVLAIPPTETILNFNGLNKAIIGTAFTWSIGNPSEINIMRNCTVNLMLTCQVRKASTGTAGAIDLRVKVNGSNIANGYRRDEVNPSGLTTREYKGIGLSLLAGDILSFSAQDTGAGNLELVTDANHVAFSLSIVEV